MSPRTLRRIHFLTDVVLIGVAWLAAYFTRYGLNDLFGRPLNPIDPYLKVLPIIIPPWIVSCWLFGIYEPSRVTTIIDALQDSLRGTLLGLLIVCSVGFFFREYELGRAVVLLSGANALVLQGLSRGLFDHWERRIRRSGTFDIPALVVGARSTGIRLVQKLEDHPDVGYRVVGFLDDDEELQGRQVASRPVLGRLTDLRAIVRDHGVREVIVAIPNLEPEKLLSLVIECEGQDVTYHVLTDVFNVLTDRSNVDMIDDVPLVRLPGRARAPFYPALKRLSDLFGALTMLALTLPLWIWWAIRIKLDSPGPVFFVQERVGRNGKIFRMVKFRTMPVDAEPYAVAPRERSDRRITNYGRWLRVTSIDELPNVLNVLGGSMSLVGPRPEMPFIVDQYQEWQRRRLLVKPGITGLWQILGRKDLPLHDNLQYDFYYIHNRSLLLDLSILLKTVGVVFRSKGAY